MESFISRQEYEKQQQISHISTWILRAAAAGTLVLFIVLCLMIRTVNARTVTWTMIISMTLLGWFCIGYYTLRVRPARAKAGHLAMLLSGETAEAEGILHLADRSVQVPKSIRVRRVTLEGEEKANPVEAPEQIRLNLDESLVRRMPEDGSRVRVRTVNDYITGIEVLAENGTESGRAGMRGSFRIRHGFRRAASLILPFLLWTMAVVIIGGFIFSRITDTDPQHKIVIYADCDIWNGAELADRLEQQLGDPIRMVKVYTFEHDLFREAGIQNADLYIVSASKAAQLRKWFVPLPENMRDREDLLILNGEPYGITVCSRETGDDMVSSYFRYLPAETYYLVFSAASLHLSGNEGAEDNRTMDAAMALMEIP